MEPEMFFGKKNRISVIYQSETTECGLACLAMIAQFYKINVFLLELREYFQVSFQGLTLRNLLKIAQAIGLKGNAVKLELGASNQPIVLHWSDDNHVLFKEYTKKKYIVYDPARGIRHLDEREFSPLFSGIRVLFQASQEKSSIQVIYSYYAQGIVTSG